MQESGLFDAVEAFSRATAELPDSALEHDWWWREYPTARFAFLITYQELRDLAVATISERCERGSPLTAVQQILAQHHIAARDLRGVLAGSGDADVDTSPADGEWPLRTVLGHLIDAETGFYGVIRYALDAHRRGDTEVLRPTRAQRQVYGWDDPSEGDLDGLLARYDEGERLAVDGLAGMTDAELALPAYFWEETLYPLRFRLLRFDAHLCEHTIQVEKALDGLGRAPAEARRLLRRIYNALGEAEGAAIGAAEIGAGRRQELAATIAGRAAEVAAAGVHGG